MSRPNPLNVYQRWINSGTQSDDFQVMLSADGQKVTVRILEFGPMTFAQTDIPTSTLLSVLNSIQQVITQNGIQLQ